MNLSEETRKGYTISSKMKKVWSVEIDLVKKLLEVCRKYNLQIWADGGTLLGVVREHGFIPWDDDIDLIMKREDFDKLCSIADQEFGYPYFFQTPHNEEDFICGQAKLMNLETSFIIMNHVKLKQKQGIFIDIFVMDGIPDDDQAAYALKQKCIEMEQTIWVFAYFKTFGYKSPALILKYIKAKLLLKNQKGYHKYFRQYEDMVRSNRISDNKYMFPIWFNYHSERKFDKQWYDETIEMPFEDIMLPVPKGYDEVLKQDYGNNYMTPVKAPSLHSQYGIFIDPESPYVEHIGELRKQVEQRRRKDLKDRILKIFRR